MKYLLDTNTCIEFLRSKNVRLIQRVSAVSSADIKLCSPVLAELYFGAYRSAKRVQNLAKIKAFVAPFAILSFDEGAAGEYAGIRDYLESQGTPIGPYDLQIAAIARMNGLTLVTNNTREFQRVPNLLLENWQ